MSEMFSGTAEKSKCFQFLYSIYFSVNVKIKKMNHRHCGFLANVALSISLFPKGA